MPTSIYQCKPAQLDQSTSWSLPSAPISDCCLLSPIHPEPFPTVLFSVSPFSSGIKPRDFTGKGKWAGTYFSSKRELARDSQTSGWGQKVSFSAAAGWR